MSLALGYAPKELGAERDFEIEILGTRRKARRLDGPAYDPQGARMRA